MAETVRYARVDEQNLIVQLSDGGASQPLHAGMKWEDAVHSLRALANIIEYTVKAREESGKGTIR